MSIVEFFSIGLGGFVGALLRFWVGDVVRKWQFAVVKVGSAMPFPWPTLVVNLLGCLAMGALMAYFEKASALRSPLLFFAIVGCLASFTTFSSLCFETFQLIRFKQTTSAFAYMFAQALFGPLIIFLGFRLTQLFQNNL